MIFEVLREVKFGFSRLWASGFSATSITTYRNTRRHMAEEQYTQPLFYSLIVFLKMWEELKNA